MAEPAVVISPNAVPREDLGHAEPITTAKQAQKTPGLGREGWWRLTITNTPIPGTYHLRTFIEEALLNPVRITYNFKNEGRKRLPLVLRNDPVPMDLPQYNPPDFLELLKKQTASYSFKDKPRADPSTLVDKDEDSSALWDSLQRRSVAIVNAPRYFKQKWETYIDVSVIAGIQNSQHRTNLLNNPQTTKTGEASGRSTEHRLQADPLP